MVTPTQKHNQNDSPHVTAQRKHEAIITAQGLGSRAEGMARCFRAERDCRHHTSEQAVAWSEGPAVCGHIITESYRTGVNGQGPEGGSTRATHSVPREHWGPREGGRRGIEAPLYPSANTTQPPSPVATTLPDRSPDAGKLLGERPRRSRGTRSQPWL